MKRFIYKIFLHLFLPFICALTIAILLDPFKVFFDYDDYYTNNPITGNREDVCLKLLSKTENDVSNFIIGSSRSQCFKTHYWCTKIHQPENTCFHYDGSLFGLFRAKNAIKYLTSTHDINNVLLIVDADFFKETKNNLGHLFIQPPLVSNESTLSYYLTFLKASINFKFIFYNLIYKVTGKYYDFMGHHLSNSKHFTTCNPSTADVWYGYDKDIESDSIVYYNNLIAKGVFFDRNNSTESPPVIGEKQMKLLNEISEIIQTNKIHLKIVISPLYNQVEFNSSDKRVLNDLFGEENVSDFSGKNDFTESISNYYENSHYKPIVANKIMDEIYR